MRYPIKLAIQKKKIISDNFSRYYTVTRIIINDNSRIKTEAQLCKFIYDNFGTGRFMCLAYQKGVAGFWKFWIGEIGDNGFIRDTQKNKELESLKKDFNIAKTYEEKAEIEEEISFERELINIDKKIKRVGPIGLIRCRPGTLHHYEDY